MGHSSILGITRTRGETEEEERRLAAVMVIAMRAEAMTKAVAEEMTEVVGRVDHQADLVTQTVATDQVAAVGRETHRDLIC